VERKNVLPKDYITWTSASDDATGVAKREICVTKTGIPKDTRAAWRECFVSSSDAADDGSLEPVTVADGHDGLSFEEPGEHLVKLPPLPPRDKDTRMALEGDDRNVGDELTSVLVFESAKSLIRGVECSTQSLTSVVRKCACARLALERLGAVGRRDPCRREQT
jgi:hypothetical protein